MYIDKYETVGDKLRGHVPERGWIDMSHAHTGYEYVTKMDDIIGKIVNIFYCKKTFCTVTLTYI